MPGVFVGVDLAIPDEIDAVAVRQPGKEARMEVAARAAVGFKTIFT